ncbi:MFS transporter [Pleomorphochaeta sp. DL1XJH-081]|uniref:MFS transporter n=1 Tax=Pleomorphochaeta sp. DL1XJH-081 TaxID=3409690 RepID=UPI003BB59D91
MKSEQSWKKQAALFLVSQNISLFGSMLVQYAIMWHITLTTQSGVMMTISILCGFIPTLIISPFAGVWADRFNRKRVIVISDAIIAIATLGMAISFALGFDAMWQLFAVLVIRSFGTGVQTPAVSALLPQIVPPEQLTRVNGIQNSIMSVVTIASPMLSGALLVVSPIQHIFLVDVSTAAVAIGILLLFLHVQSPERTIPEGPISYLNDLRDGIHYIQKHDFIHILFAYCALFFVFFAPVAFLTPLQTTRSYGPDVWRLTAIEVAFSGGMMLGGLLIATWQGFSNKLHTMVFSLIVSGVCIVALGLTPPFWLYLAGMALMGITMPLFNTPFTVLLQQKVDEQYLGRVFSVFTMISSSAMPLAMLAFGPLADIIQIEWMLLITGALLAGEAFLMLRNKRLMQAGLPVGNL